MFAKLSGKVDEILQDKLILDVGGVGYLVSCSNKTLFKLAPSEKAALLIETQVREDSIQLFGFLDSSEKLCFNMLCTVKGIGSRLALTVLSYLSPEELHLAIISGDKQALKSIPSIGIKVAERLIVELKDKFGSFEGLSKVGSSSAHSSSNQAGSNMQDAISALINLGISRSEAYQTVSNILGQNPEIKLDELIRSALQQLAK